MRRSILLLLLCSMTVQADVFKCQTPSGAIVFSDVPCDEGEKFQKVQPSESASDPAAAQRDLERQRAYAERVAAENEAARQSKAGVSSLPDYSSAPPATSSSSDAPSRSPSSAADSNPGPQPRSAPPVPRTSPPVSR